MQVIAYQLECLTSQWYFIVMPILQMKKLRFREAFCLRFREALFTDEETKV